MTLSARLSKLEAKHPEPEEYRPWVRAVGDDRDHDALHRLLADEGYDTSPDSPDRFLIRWIVSPAASQAHSEMIRPYVAPRRL